MHICHIATGFLAGTEVIVRQLICMQLAAGHRVTLIYGKTHLGLEAEISALPPEVELLPWQVGREISWAEDRTAYRALVDMLRRVKPDIVHLHNAKAGALGRLVCRRLGLRSIYSPHGLSFVRRDVRAIKRLVFFAIEWALALFGDVLAPSSAGEHRAMRWLPRRKYLVPNGVDMAEIRRRGAGAPVVAHDGRLRIVVCGRIWPQKNPELVSRLAESSPPDWEWLWVGDGHDRALLGDRVTVLGWQRPADSLATVRSADIYLQASRWEGMSFALIEAMAVARACVVSNVPGNRDLVRDGFSGLVCTDEQEYRRALAALAADPGLRARLSDAATQQIADEFSLTLVAARWSAVYRSLAPKGAAFHDFVANSGT